MARRTWILIIVAVILLALLYPLKWSFLGLVEYLDQSSSPPTPVVRPTPPEPKPPIPLPCPFCSNPIEHKFDEIGVFPTWHCNSCNVKGYEQTYARMKTNKGFCAAIAEYVKASRTGKATIATIPDFYYATIPAIEVETTKLAERKGRKTTEKTTDNKQSKNRHAAAYKLRCGRTIKLRWRRV